MNVPVNYWAILVCGIASMVWGSIYYGPLFGKMYISMMGWDKKSPAEQEAAKKGMMKSYVLSFVGSLVMAYILSHVLAFGTSYMHSEGVSAGLSTGFWMWLGFIAPVTMGDILWGNKTWKFWLLSNAYYLIQLLIFGVILSLWK